MKIVIDTKSWHPLIRFILLVILVNFVIAVLAWVIEYFTGWQSEFWKGYAIGFLLSSICLR